MPNSYKPENIVFSRKIRENRYEKEAEFYPFSHEKDALQSLWAKIGIYAEHVKPKLVQEILK